MKVRKRERLPSITCPICKQKAMYRTSVQVTDTVREVRLDCCDPDCNHGFVAQIAVIKTVRPSRLTKSVLQLGNQNLGRDRTADPRNDLPLLDMLMTSSG